MTGISQFRLCGHLDSCKNSSKGQLCFFFITEDHYPTTVSAGNDEEQPGNDEEQPEHVKDFTEGRHVEARG